MRFAILVNMFFFFLNPLLNCFKCYFHLILPKLLQVINESVIVLDSEGREIESQLLPLSNASVGIRNYHVKAYMGITPSDTPKFWLAFAATAPPFGFSTYIVSSAKRTG